jgi:hypothetical protein
MWQEWCCDFHFRLLLASGQTTWLSLGGSYCDLQGLTSTSLEALSTSLGAARAMLQRTCGRWFPLRFPARSSSCLWFSGLDDVRCGVLPYVLTIANDRTLPVSMPRRSSNRLLNGVNSPVASWSQRSNSKKASPAATIPVAYLSTELGQDALNGTGSENTPQLNIYTCPRIPTITSTFWDQRRNHVACRRPDLEMTNDAWAKSGSISRRIERL